MAATRSVALAGMLGAAVAGPYAISQAPDSWPSGWGPSQQPAAATASDAGATQPVSMQPPDASAPEGPGSTIYQSPASLVGPYGASLEQVLRWDIDRNWVYRHWARKSTGLADPSLFGVRVPLVTGSGMTDFAGSLSYYFDAAGVLQRIRLDGRTADTSRVVALAAQRFGMRPQPALSPGDQLLQAREGEQTRAELRTRPESVLWATSPHESFRVRMELNRPGGPRWVEPPRLDLNLPSVNQASSAASTPLPPEFGSQSDGRPVLPSRSVVPDGSPSPAATAGQSPSSPGTQSAGPPATAPAQAKPPVIGKPVEAPRPETAPLDGYRDRFRWPG